MQIAKIGYLEIYFRKFTLQKAHWDSVHLDRIEQACDPSNHADIAAIIMQV